MWRARTPDPDQVLRLADERKTHDLFPLVIHDSYLINLASSNQIIFEQSVAAFAGEIERALIIGAEYLVAHPGNYRGTTIEQGLISVAKGLALAWDTVDARRKAKARLTILLENTAGAGAQLGGDLQELAIIRELATPYLDIPIGYCLDTCHCFVYGYDLAHETGLKRLVKDADSKLGLEHVPVFHTNDAKACLGSHLDRHQNIGDGYIGTEGFRRILNHPKLKDKAFILETPVDNPGDDLRNVQRLKELVSPNKRSIRNPSSRSGTSVGRRIRPST